MAFRAKINFFGGLKNHFWTERPKVRCAIRGDRMRHGLDFDAMRPASHMPSQAGCSLLLSAAAAVGYVIVSFETVGAYTRALNDLLFRITMRQPPRSGGTFAAPGNICVLRRAMPGGPSANTQ